MKLRFGRLLTGTIAAALVTGALVVPAGTAVAAPTWPLTAYTADDVPVTSIDRTSRTAVNDSFQVLLDAFRTTVTWSGSTTGCIPGSLSQAAQHAAFDAVNWYRAMAGADPVVEDTSLSQTSQAWALAAQAGAVFKHRPSAADGDNLGSCWTDAAFTGSTGNLAGNGGAFSIVSFIDERSNVSANINAIVGHRGVVLDRRTGTFGFGSTKNWASLLHGPYDQSVTSPNDSWPPAGYYPAQVMTPYWHYVPRNPAARFDNVTVSVTKNGAPLSGVRLVLTAAGGPLVWAMPNSVTELPSTDVTYRVTISGLRRFSDNQALPDVTYEVISFKASGATRPLLEGRLPGEDPEKKADPVISGTARVGANLTVSNGTWSNIQQDATFTYQWLRSKVVAQQETWEEIAGATSNTYTPVATDEGRKLFARVTIHSGDATDLADSNLVTVAAAAPATTPKNTAAPKVSGTAKVGSTLTGSKGTWTSNYPITYAYQWLRDGAAISGATSSTYQLAAADVGAKLSLRVTATAGDKSAKATSASTAVIQPVVSISGTVNVGKKVTAATTGFPSGYKLTYKWYANGSAISGATKSSYTISASRAGKALTVKVTGKKSGKTTLTATSSKATVAKGTLTAATPKISGTVKVGKTVKVSKGTWSSSVKFSYAWYADGKKISKATKSSYKIPASLAGKALTVKVTGKRTGYTTVTMTSAASTVAKGTLKSATPKISGTVKVGKTVKVSKGTWSSSVKFSYAWLADGLPIAGATSSSFTIPKALAQQVLTVAVTGKKSGYTTVTKTSAGKRIG